jgi:hypothetical protein
MVKDIKAKRIENYWMDCIVTIVPSGFKDVNIIVYEDCTGNIDVRYLSDEIAELFSFSESDLRSIKEFTQA